MSRLRHPYKYKLISVRHTMPTTGTIYRYYIQILYTDTIYNTIYNLSRARSNTRDVLALIVVLATSDLNISPGPVRATRATADNGNVVAVRGNGAGAGDVLNSQAGDGEVGGWVSVEVAAVVVLFDQDTVPVLVRLMRFIRGVSVGWLAYLLMESRVMPE